MNIEEDKLVNFPPSNVFYFLYILVWLCFVYDVFPYCNLVCVYACVFAVFLWLVKSNPILTLCYSPFPQDVGDLIDHDP